MRYKAYVVKGILLFESGVTVSVNNLFTLRGKIQQALDGDASALDDVLIDKNLIIVSILPECVYQNIDVRALHA